MLWTLVFGALLTICAAETLPGIPTNFTASDDILSAIADDVAHKLEKEYIDFLKTGVESTALRQMAVQFAKSHSRKDLFRKELYELQSADQFLMCTVCRATVNILAKMFRDENGELNGENSKEDTKKIYMHVCTKYEIQTEEVCEGLFESNWPTAEHILQHSVIDSRSFCSLFLEFGFCNVKKNSEYDWYLDIDANGPVVTGPKSEIPSKSAEDLKILHLTDIHYDPLYEVGALADCVEPVCCQRQKDTTEGTSKAAGYWGDYRDCDTPLHVIENAFAHIKEKQADFDFIIHTGDVIDHMVWATSVEKNKAAMIQVNDLLTKTFPDTPVYPCIGNHEPHPLNLFSPSDAPDEINTKWLYEFMYELWSKWLPASTKDTILKGGYYTVSPKKGLRIISLNSNECYSTNWWLFFSGTNKQPQLQWLHDTLLAAEAAGEFVHILSHIPSGDGTCWSVWSREFNKIIERFHHIISGTFNGHSHQDEMNVHYSANGHAIGISWNGGSLTSYSYKNANYRIYQVEPKSFQVVDHETWIYNLTEANEHGEARTPNWYEEYNFSTEFTSDLSPAGIDTLLDKMADNPNLLRKFYTYKSKSSDMISVEHCGRGCLQNTICRIATTVNNQRNRCEELSTRLGLALDGQEPTTVPTTASPTSIQPTTELPTTKDPGGGASAMFALSFSTLLAFFVFMKCII